MPISEIMKKILLLSFILPAFYLANAQVDSTVAVPKKTPRSQVDLSNRAGDHFLFQIGFDNWAGKPDSIHTKGFSRSFNFYLMFDFPFKTDPRWSVGIGLGVGTSNIYFDKQLVEVAGSTQTLRFRNVADTNNFKKYKLATAYLEAPVELRFTADPLHSGKSFKVAIGAKVGFLANAHTKAKTLRNKSGGVITNYVEKINSKKYFNGNRLVVTGRVGYGSISLFGTYQVNNFLKEGVGPNIKPYSIGLTLSGL